MMLKPTVARYKMMESRTNHMYRPLHEDTSLQASSVEDKNNTVSVRLFDATRVNAHTKLQSALATNGVTFVSSRGM